MHKSLRIAIWAVMLSIVIFSAAYVPDIYFLLSMPQEYTVVEGEEHTLDFRLPLGVYARSEQDNILKLNGHDVSMEGIKVQGYHPLMLETLSRGNAQFEFKLFGLIPVKKMTVQVVSPVKVFPGGNSIGVKLYTQGVLVVAVSEVTGIDGRDYCPAVEAGIAVGDSIISINDTKVRDADHVITLLNQLRDEEISITIKRGKYPIVKKVKPVKSQEDGKYRIGAWVRDKTAGVGTLSFYCPETGIYGALGHAITDVDTGLLLSVEEGEILESRVASIEKGRIRKPGEIKGIFFEEQNKLGTIEKNTQLGIYGVLDKQLENSYFPEPVSVAFHQQVKEGKAKILTTVDKEVEMYDIEILKVARQNYPSPKGMVIKVVDKKLIDKTGGIVQGMSGSPIIQDGKLVGAVTHVFVNDPLKGYGIFAEWMILEAGLDKESYEIQVDKTG